MSETEIPDGYTLVDPGNVSGNRPPVGSLHYSKRRSGIVELLAWVWASKKPKVRERGAVLALVRNVGEEKPQKPRVIHWQTLKNDYEEQSPSSPGRRFHADSVYLHAADHNDWHVLDHDG